MGRSDAVALDLDRGADCSEPLNVAELRAVYAEMTDPARRWSGPTIEAVANAHQGITGRGLLSMGLDTVDNLDGRQRLLASLYFAVSVASRYRRGRGIYVPQLDPGLYPQMCRLDAAVVPFAVVGGMPGRQGFAGYHFTHEPGVLIDLFHEAPPLVARMLLERIAINRSLGAPTSAEAEHLVTLILAGQIKFPDAPPELGPVTEHRDILLGAIADRLSELVGYDAAGSRATFKRGAYPPIRGCTIADAAMSALGVIVPADRGRKPTADDKAKRAKAILDRQDLLRPALVPSSGPLVEGHEAAIFTAIGRLNTRF